MLEGKNNRRFETSVRYNSPSAAAEALFDRKPDRRPASPSSMKNRFGAELVLVVVSFIFGASFVVVKQALSDVSTLLFLAVRFSLATLWLLLMLIPRLRARRQTWPDVRNSLQGGVFAGLFLFAGYAFQTFGLETITPAQSGFLTGLYIPLVPIVGALVYRKAPKKVEIIGVAAAAVGMALLTLQGSTLGNVFQLARGDLLTVGCAVCFAFHILSLERVTAGGDVAFVNVAQIGTAALLAASSFWWAETPHVIWTWGVWFAWGITSLFATAFALGGQTWAQQRTTATRTALILALEPVFAWLTSFVLTGESLSTRATVGAALILGGILIVEVKPPRPGKP